MKRGPLDILDLRGGVFLTLPDILDILQPRATATDWSFAAYLDADGSEYLEAVVEGHNWLDDGLKPFERLPYSRLVEIMKPVRQVIWGVFTGYEAAAATPWIVLAAIDSSFWRVQTDDLETRRRLRTTFSNVREDRV